jgi:hypothetical protein
LPDRATSTAAMTDRVMQRASRTPNFDS